MSIPKENRQQMINMMYLVLTAMLALNVSSEILNAFTIVNKSLEKSNEAMDQNNLGRFAAFDGIIKSQPDNKQLVLNKAKAQQAMQIGDDLNKYIDGLLSQVETEAGGYDAETGELKKRDDLDIATRLFVEGTPKNGQKGVGYEMIKKLEEGRKQFLGLFDPKDQPKLEDKLQLKFEPKKPGGDWIRENFYQMPAVAVKTLLLKLKSDIKATEGEVIANLQTDISQIAIKSIQKFDQFGAKIIGPTYVMQGDPFEAQLFLSASSSEAGAVSITANGTGVATNQDGVGIFKQSTSSIGEKTISGSISLKNKQTNKVEVYPFEPFKYTVAAPFAVVSADKMNVFYIGLDNPISVSASGVSDANVKASLSSGSATPNGAGKYVVRVSTPGKTSVIVSAKGKQLRSQEFRVKNIPDPIAKVGGKSGGAMSSGEMKAQLGLGAILENFDFDAKFEVISYSVFYLPKREDPVQLPNGGAYFTAPVKGVIGKIKPGDTVYFEDIKVKGPDGTTRKIPSIVFKIV